MVNHSKTSDHNQFSQFFAAPCFIEQHKNGEGGSGNLAFDDMMSGAAAVK